MKWIFAALTAQLLLTTFALVKLNDVSDQNAHLTRLFEQQQNAASENLPLRLNNAGNLNSHDNQLQYAAMQSELHSLTVKIDALSRQLNEDKLADNNPPPPTVEQSNQQDLLRSELNNLMYAGPVSQRQLDTIQMKAAQLHPSQRKQMFSDISRAVNSGQLKMSQ